MSQRQQTGPIRVLLVDDHQTVLWGLQQLVDSRQPGMAVAGTASCADDALRLAQALQPDVVLLDMDLGSSDGAQLIPQLQAACQARILILTGLRDEARTDRAVLQGARGIVRKEASAELVLKAIESVYRGELWLDRITTARVFQQQKEREQQQVLHKRMAGDLTARELQIVCALVTHSGTTNKELAGELSMSEHTLRNHLSSIYQKLDVDNRLKLYVYAVKNGLGQPSS